MSTPSPSRHQSFKHYATTACASLVGGRDILTPPHTGHECQRLPRQQLDGGVEARNTSDSRASLSAPAAGTRADGASGGQNGGAGHDTCVLYNEDNGIATLTINRPKWKNPFSKPVFSRLAALLNRAAQSDSVVAVVITGAGDYFSSGADLKELRNGTSPVPMLQQPFGVFCVAVLTFPKLLVAAVNGPAVGVGVTLLPHCDIVYAFGGARSSNDSRSGGGDGDRERLARLRHGDSRKPEPGARHDGATFWAPFFRLAIVPEFCSSVTFPEILGLSLSNEMLIMGRKLSAHEALLSGLVSTVLTADTPEAFLSQVKDDLRRTVLETPMAAESVKTFRSIMWRERRPRLLRVLEEECAELDRRMQAGHPQLALKHLASRAAGGRSKL